MSTARSIASVSPGHASVSAIMGSDMRAVFTFIAANMRDATGRMARTVAVTFCQGERWQRDKRGEHHKNAESFRKKKLLVK